ncbi:hypothetical protein ACQP1G_16440 [Nocardia sp. CA-107356]|uniref:hypothetical protein n=1 Tax=Nocardia sp. CA-107356 TaxID=3239972 RepID=UPI003D8A9F70
MAGADDAGGSFEHECLLLGLVVGCDGLDEPQRQQHPGAGAGAGAVADDGVLTVHAMDTDTVVAMPADGGDRGCGGGATQPVQFDGEQRDHRIGVDIGKLRGIGEDAQPLVQQIRMRACSSGRGRSPNQSSMRAWRWRRNTTAVASMLGGTVPFPLTAKPAAHATTTPAGM